MIGKKEWSEKKREREREIEIETEMIPSK